MVDQTLIEESAVTSASKHETRKARTLRRLRLAVAMAPLMLAVAGCANSQQGGLGGDAALATGSIATIDPSYAIAPEEQTAAKGLGAEEQALGAYAREAANLAMKEGKTFGALVHLSKVYDSNPRDRKVIYDYARHLRYVGLTTDAMKILNDGLHLYPNDQLLRLERAKALIAAGVAQDALPEIETLLSERPKDPAILQSYGIALDRLGRHGDAQQAYRTAMSAGRPSANLLNNAGLSHLISGDLDTAEKLLRDAVIAHGAGVQVRQNLAMTLAIKGDMKGARAYAQQALPKATAKELLAYYESIVRQQDAWSVAAEQS